MTQLTTSYEKSEISQTYDRLHLKGSQLEKRGRGGT